MKKKAKEREQQWLEMKKQAPKEDAASVNYRDRYRSGLRTVVEAKVQEKQQAKNEEMRIYRNFYRNNKFSANRGLGSVARGPSSALGGRGTPAANPQTRGSQVPAD